MSIPNALPSTPPVSITPPAAGAGTGTTATTEPEHIDLRNPVLTGFDEVGNTIGSVMADGLSYTGILRPDENGNPRPATETVVAAAGIGAGGTALSVISNMRPADSGGKVGIAEAARNTGGSIMATGLKVTPTLVSAILGPAIADGVTMLAPTLVKKYKDPKGVTDAKKKAEIEANNQWSKYSRMAAAGAAVAVIAGAAFLIKPDLFKKLGTALRGPGGEFNYMRPEALEGATHIAIEGGKKFKLTGVVAEAGLAAALKAQRGITLADDAVVSITKTTAGMTKNAKFSNRLVLGALGGASLLGIANGYAGAKEEDKWKWAAAAAGVGAVTVGGIAALGRLTDASVAAKSGAGGLLAKNQLFMKPNVEWLKSYGKIASVTAVPAGTSAGQYFNIMNDFDEITSARSPFRK